MRQSAADLERWLLDWSELSAALDEESSQRYIAMTCHTDNAEAEKAYLHFVENIEPQLKPRQFELAKLCIAHPLRAGCSPWSAGIRPGTFELERPTRRTETGAPFALRGLRSRHEEPGRTVPPGERAAGNRGSQAEPAVSEAERLAHGAVSRRGEDAGADGPLPRGTRPRAAPGSLGTGRATGGCRKRRSSRRSSTSSSQLREQIAQERRLRQLPRLRLPQAGPVRLHAGRLRAVPRGGGEGNHAGRARAAGRTAPAARTRSRCVRGTWRWTR